jgi:hypothetical protein
MTGTHTPPGVTGELLYAEDKSGLEQKIIIYAIAAPIVVVIILIPFLLVASNGLAVLLAFPVVIAAIWAMASMFLLKFLWPVGIRIDSAGIRIGGLRAWERRQLSGRWPPRRPFHVGAQGRAVFTCPWEGVKELYLVRSRDELSPLTRQRSAFRKRTSQLRTPLGYFTTAKAGLVIVTDPALTSSDPAGFRANWSRIGHIRGVISPTWLVPTRHPDELQAALARVPNAPAVQDSLPLDGKFAFYARLDEQGGMHRSAG